VLFFIWFAELGTPLWNECPRLPPTQATKPKALRVRFHTSAMPRVDYWRN
jgi:hypothetical protein